MRKKDKNIVFHLVVLEFYANNGIGSHFKQIKTHVKKRTIDKMFKDGETVCYLIGPDGYNRQDKYHILEVIENELNVNCKLKKYIQEKYPEYLL